MARVSPTPAEQKNGFAGWQATGNGTIIDIHRRAVKVCLKAVQDQLKQCLGEAMSREDKTSCAERQLAKANVCENGECVIERTTSHKDNDVFPQKK